MKSEGGELVITASQLDLLGIDLPPLCTWYVGFKDDISV